MMSITMNTMLFYFEIAQICVFYKSYNDTRTDSETKHSLGATIFSVICQ